MATQRRPGGAERKAAQPKAPRTRTKRAPAGKRRTAAGTPDTSKFNATVRKTILAHLRTGGYRTTAFRLAGIHEDTGFEWLRLGREKPAEHPEYAALELAVMQAEAAYENEMLGVVRKAAVAKKPSSWLPAMTALERTRPQRFARRDTTVVEGGESPLQVRTYAAITDPETRELLAEALRRVAAARPGEPGGPGVGDESPQRGD